MRRLYLRHFSILTSIRLTVFYIGALIAAIAVGLSLAAIILFVLPNWHIKEQRIAIKPGMALPHIARLLENEGVIFDANLFRLGVFLQGRAGAMHAGEFTIPAGASMQNIVTLLATGKVHLYPITISEGLTSAQIVTQLRENPLLQGEISTIPPEGSLLPETHFVPRGTQRQHILDMMQADMLRLLDELWDKRDADLPFVSKQEAVILASIIEKETGIAKERAQIAGVFINRLRRGMLLQSDPTIIYGLVGGQGTLGRPIRMSEIKRKTAYNTYVIKGLPPTPIANPGYDALYAALHPAETDALYFVADGTGGHVFATTLDAHNQNVRNWRRIEQERKRRK